MTSDKIADKCTLIKRRRVFDYMDGTSSVRNRTSSFTTRTNCCTCYFKMKRVIKPLVETEEDVLSRVVRTHRVWRLAVFSLLALGCPLVVIISDCSSWCSSTFLSFTLQRHDMKPHVWEPKMLWPDGYLLVGWVHCGIAENCWFNTVKKAQQSLQLLQNKIIVTF